MSWKKKLAYALLPVISIFVIYEILEKIEWYIMTELATEQMSATTSGIYTMIPTLMNAILVIMVLVVIVVFGILYHFTFMEDKNNEEK